MSLPALLDLFRHHRQQASGILRLGGEHGRVIYMEAGAIVFAQSGAPEDRLTAILVDRGKLTQAQMDYALANLKPGLSIGKNLIEMGFITQRDLLDTAKVQVERVVWGAMGIPDEAPAFEPKALESTVVRLPLDTPAMLLAGLLGLGDRERVLDLLGPVNQIAVLENKRIHELSLPQDLSRILALLDGSRTILELSRESGIEPFRLGAFCLFLREMGWGRLHERPLPDRAAPEQGRFPETDPPALPLPEAPPPPLIAAIEAAARSTTNLDHMAAALDELSLPLPAPSQAEPLDPLHQEIEELTLPISEASSFSAAPPSSASLSRKRVRTFLVIFLAVLGLLAGAWWLRSKLSFFPAPSPAPAPAPPVAPKAAAAPAPPHTSPQGDLPPLRSPQNPSPTGKPATNAEAGRGERLTAIKAGVWDQALHQGKAHQASFRTPRWTLRLEVACVGATVQNAMRLLEQQEPDLWLFPIRMRDGKTCYQVLLGDYPSETAAKDAIQRLPKAFNTSTNRPKVFRIAELPDRQ